LLSNGLVSFRNSLKSPILKFFEKWLTKYIDNWVKDDDFCLHIVQPIIKKYPDLINRVKSWSHSKNMWLRRASAVSFITTAGNFYVTRHNLKDIFEVAETLGQLIFIKGKDGIV